MFILEGLSFCPYINELIQLSVYSWQTRLAYLVQVEIEWISWRWMRREFFQLRALWQVATLQRRSFYNH